MTMLSTTGSQLTLEQARRIIDIFDENGDQEIDFEEFCNLLDEGVISWRFRTGTQWPGPALRAAVSSYQSAIHS
jgi:hypothetical protein